MLVVHHLENSRSQRILWALEELGVAYEVKRYERDKVTNLAPASLKKVHPLGKSPVIVDGALTIAESGAIIDYLVTTYGDGALVPELNSPEHREYNYWLHYAEGSLMPPLVMKLVFDKVANSPMPFFVKPVAKGISKKVTESYIGPNIKDSFDFIEHHLQQNEWFTGGKLTGADIQMSFPLEASVASGVVGDQYPKITAYVKRFQSRPAYQKALETGGPYDYEAA
jgi:glutathione S-transferase